MSDDDKKTGAVQSIRNMASNSVARLYGGKKSAATKEKTVERPAMPLASRERTDEGEVRGEHRHERPGPPQEAMEAESDGAMEVMQEETAGNAPTVSPRPSAKTILIAVAALTIVGIFLVRACSSEPQPKTENAAKSSEGQWRRFELSEVRPLTAIDPKTVPGLVTGVEREHQLGQRVSSITKPIEVPASLKVEVPVPVEPGSAKVNELEQKVAALTKELEASKKEIESVRARRQPKAPAKKIVAKLPSVKVMAIARTDGCLACPVLALLDVDGVARQVGSGDQIGGYTVSVASDRVVLTRNKEQHVFYSLTPPN